IAFVSGAPVYVYAPAFVVILLLVGTVPGLMGAAQASSNAWLRPLGLEIIQMPRSEVRYNVASGTQQHHVSGPVIWTGERHGGGGRIELQGRPFKTRVNGKFSKLDVSSDDGKLSASDESPAEARTLI